MQEIDPLLDKRWTDFVVAHPDASIFHSAEWLSALKTTYGYTPVAYVDAPAGGGITSGQVFCAVDSWLTGRRLVSVPFSDHSELLLSDRSSVHSTLRNLQSTVDSRQCRYVEIRPVQHAGLDAIGFRPAEKFHFHTIDLTEDLATLYRRFHKDCVQRKIRRSEREDLQYSEGRSEAIIRQFYELLLVTHERHHSPPQPIAWFLNLADSLGDQMKVRIVSKDDRPVAGMITLSFKDTMTYKYGCSDAKVHNLGGMASLFWKSIQEAKSLGMRVFDMGRSDLGQTGLIAFKEHWGAERKTISYWRYPGRVVMGSSSWEFRAAKALLACAPTVAIRIAGTLLYRHMASVSFASLAFLLKVTSAGAGG